MRLLPLRSTPGSEEAIKKKSIIGKKTFFHRQQHNHDGPSIGISTTKEQLTPLPPSQLSQSSPYLDQSESDLKPGPQLHISTNTTKSLSSSGEFTPSNNYTLTSNSSSSTGDDHPSFPTTPRTLTESSTSESQSVDPSSNSSSNSAPQGPALAAADKSTVETVDIDNSVSNLIVPAFRGLLNLSSDDGGCQGIDAEESNLEDSHSHVVGISGDHYSILYTDEDHNEEEDDKDKINNHDDDGIGSLEGVEEGMETLSAILHVMKNGAEDFIAISTASVRTDGEHQGDEDHQDFQHYGHYSDDEDSKNKGGDALHEYRSGVQKHHLNHAGSTMISDTYHIRVPSHIFIEDEETMSVVASSICASICGDDNGCHGGDEDVDFGDGKMQERPHLPPLHYHKNNKYHHHISNSMFEDSCNAIVLSPQSKSKKTTVGKSPRSPLPITSKSTKPHHSQSPMRRLLGKLPIRSISLKSDQQQQQQQNQCQGKPKTCPLSPPRCDTNHKDCNYNNTSQEGELIFSPSDLCFSDHSLQLLPNTTRASNLRPKKARRRTMYRKIKKFLIPLPSTKGRRESDDSNQDCGVNDDVPHDVFLVLDPNISNGHQKKNKGLSLGKSPQNRGYQSSETKAYTGIDDSVGNVEEDKEEDTASYHSDESTSANHHHKNDSNDCLQKDIDKNNNDLDGSYEDYNSFLPHGLTCNNLSPSSFHNNHNSPYLRRLSGIGNGLLGAAALNDPGQVDGALGNNNHRGHRRGISSSQSSISTTSDLEYGTINQHPYLISADANVAPGALPCSPSLSSLDGGDLQEEWSLDYTRGTRISF